MERIEPKRYLSGIPCSIVAVTTACDLLKGTTYTDNPPMLRENGYTTLAETNKYIRANLNVKKATYYTKKERPKLKDLHLNGKAIVTVLGHYLYLDNETYYSFFDNENDEVVQVWEVR